MPGKAYTALWDVAVEQYGYVTTDDARALGMQRRRLVDLAQRGQADRVAHGVYRLRAVPRSGREQLMEATLWPRGQGVISHDSALDLWDLCNVNPVKVHVSIPLEARIRREIPSAYAVHRRRLKPTDVTRVEGIPVVTVRRAILDGHERGLRAGLLDEAVATGYRIGQLTADETDEITAARA
jgi:predicted transcriptional regulator of viral defense system